MENLKKSKKEILLKAQEVTFARALAGNNKAIRDRAIKRLRKWFEAKSDGKFKFGEDDLMRLWKGLFYCMWMSDKPLVQEELADVISRLIHAFRSPSQAILFVRCFFRTMGNEWFGIDQLRLNKFLMLVRRFLRQSLELVRRQGWDAGVIGELNAVFTDTVLLAPAATFPLGLMTHFCEIFLEELAKVGGDDLPPEAVVEFLRPFVRYYTQSRIRHGRKALLKNVFDRLIYQHDLGLDFKAKFDAWSSAGFPGKSIHDMRQVEPEEEEGEGAEEEEKEKGERVLDPRAGMLNVELPQIQFDPTSVAKLFLAGRAKLEGRLRSALAKQANKFTDLAAGRYPFANQYRIRHPEVLVEMREEKRVRCNRLWEAAHALEAFDERLDARTDKEIFMPGAKPPVPAQQQKKSRYDGEDDQQVFADFLAKRTTKKRQTEVAAATTPPKKARLEDEEAQGRASSSKKKRVAQDDLNASSSKKSALEATPSMPSSKKKKLLQSEVTPTAVEGSKSLKKKTLQQLQVTPVMPQNNQSSKKKKLLQSEVTPTVVKDIGSSSKKKTPQQLQVTPVMPQNNQLSSKKKTPQQSEVTPTTVEGSKSPFRKPLQGIGTSLNNQSSENESPFQNNSTPSAIEGSGSSAKKKTPQQFQITPVMSQSNLSSSKKSGTVVESSNSPATPDVPSSKKKKRLFTLNNSPGLVIPQSPVEPTPSSADDAYSPVSVLARLSAGRVKDGSPRTSAEKKRKPSEGLAERKRASLEKISPRPAIRKMSLATEENVFVQAENKVIAELRDEMQQRRTSPRKARVARADDEQVTPLKVKTAVVDEQVTPPKEVLSRKRLSLVPASAVAAKAGGKRQSLGPWLVEDVAASPKRKSLRIAQKVKPQSPPAVKTPLRGKNMAARNTPASNAALLSAAKAACGSTPGSGKKVNIVLHNNVAQEVSEYHRALRSSPGIPFDADKKPSQSVLKPAAVRSPINPFYLLKENHKLNKISKQ